MLEIKRKSKAKLSKILDNPAIPGSKYEAVRLLFLSALSKGECTLTGLPDAQDILDAIQVLQDLGIEIKHSGATAVIQGFGGKFTPKSDKIYLGKSGTLARFVIPFVALQSQPIYVDADAQLCSRPMEEIFSALAEQGVSISSKDGHLPATIQGGTLDGKQIEIDVSRSSQFLSGLLLIAPIVGMKIVPIGKLVSKSFVELTLDLMKKFGATPLSAQESYSFAPTGYNSVNYQIAADWSSVSYFLGLAAITNTPAKISNLDFASKQGEAEFYTLLQQMGCEISKEENSLIFKKRDTLRGIEVDMNLLPDVVPTLAIVATYAESKTTIYNIEHLRYKECDRLNLVVEEINKLGGYAQAFTDKMIIYPQKPKGGLVSTYDDHRMAMSFALLGLSGIPCTIDKPDCVNKSFPSFWKMMNVEKS